MMELECGSLQYDYKDNDMTHQFGRRGFVLGAAALAMGAALPSRAQSRWPQKPIKIVVGFADANITA